MELEQIRRESERYMTEFVREEYLAYAGFKPAPDLAPILHAHAELLGPAALATVQNAFGAAAEGSETRNRLRCLLQWMVVSRSMSAFASLYAKSAQRQVQSVATVGGRSIPYNRLAAEIANATSPAARQALDDARVAIIERELSSLFRGIFELDRSQVESLEIAPDCVSTYSTLKGLSLRRLKSETDAFLADTDALWNEVRPEMIERVLRMPPSDATSADVSALFRASAFDDAFPSAGMEERLLALVRRMGIDPTAEGRVTFDSEPRPGKHPRPACARARVPDEIYLITSPGPGGPNEWARFLHETAHGIHLGYTDAALPIEYRQFGDLSVTETYAAVFEHLLDDPSWLAANTTLGRRLPEFVRWRAFEDLYNMRRRCGRIAYEIELYSRGADLDRLPGRYADIMTRSTGFLHRAADAFIDVDPMFYIAEYLRAHQLRSQLEGVLVDRFGTAWWANPASGPWMIEHLFSQGGRDTVEQIAQSLTGEALSFQPLINSIRERLHP